MKKIAGKTFMSREEAGLPPLTQEEIEAAKRRIREGRAPQPKVPPETDPLFLERLHDDVKGTEFDPDWPPKADNDDAADS